MLGLPTVALMGPVPGAARKDKPVISIGVEGSCPAPTISCSSIETGPDGRALEAFPATLALAFGATKVTSVVPWAASEPAIKDSWYKNLNRVCTKVRNGASLG